MPHRLIRTADDLDALFTLLGSLKLPLTIEWTLGLDRSAAQNRLQFMWARETAEQLGDRTPDEVRCDWKLRHGVPIMREDSPEFRATYDRLIKPLSYPEKLKAMQLIEVTSLMKVRQFVRYLDTIQRECAEQGIALTQPDEDLANYHRRYRQPEGKAA